MKKILTLLFVLLVPYVVFSQSAKEMEEAIEGKYTVDNRGNVTFSKVIELPGVSKEVIFTRAENFFTYYYNDAKSVIQTKDIERGLIVGKGKYGEVHRGISFGSATTVDTWHIIRVDVQEGRARIIVSLTEYTKARVVNGGAPIYDRTNVCDEYPINKKGGSKTVMMKAFYKSYLHAQISLDNLEASLRNANENQAGDISESEDW